eukprot:2654475-Amphidinium_carterae.1
MALHKPQITPTWPNIAPTCLQEAEVERGASLMYPNTALDPQRPNRHMRETSIPERAIFCAPSTLKL